MSKIAVLLTLTISLAACGVVDTLVDGFKHVTAVENDLAASTGMKPKVGFHWSNGVLDTVTVTFPRLYDGKPLAELATVVRGSVARQFKQMPTDLVLAFSIGNASSAQALRRPERQASTHRAGL